MTKKKMHRLIDFILLMFPLFLLMLACYRTGNADITGVESLFSVFRSLDFGLFDYINANMLGNTNNVIVLLMVDLMIYYLYWRLFDLVYCLFSFFIDILKTLSDKWGGLSDKD